MAACTKGKTRVSLIKKVTAVLVVSLVAAFALAACAPSANDGRTDEGGEAKSEEVQGDEGFSVVNATDFTERSTGLYPDIQKNAQYQNSGNRGCMACHDNLFDLDKSNGTFTHITTYVGLKDATYTGDCYVCHDLEEGAAGNLMSENMHVLHYSSEQFVEANGNCWSCHAQVTNPETGEIEMKLFEEVQYEASYGGYGLSPLTDGTIAWNEIRGWSSGFLSGVSVEGDPNLVIDLDQAASDEEDEFLIMNYRSIDEDDSYATIDDSWTLKVTGTNEETELTLDDLKAMPQTEITAAQWCFVAGTNSAMVDNRPMKGVLLEDFIDELGGLAGDYNAANFIPVDPWEKGYGVDLQAYLDAGAVLVYENYGHDLTLEQGGPLVLIVPGMGGNMDVKWIVGIDFFAAEATLNIADYAEYYFDLGWSVDINTSWFANDGDIQGTVGETVQIEGASWGWTFGSVDHAIAKIMFSFDYGQNWVECDVPADFDSAQWIHYTLNWTPEEAGTYVVKAKAVDTSGNEQRIVSNLLVTVGE